MVHLRFIGLLGESLDPLSPLEIIWVQDICYPARPSLPPSVVFPRSSANSLPRGAGFSHRAGDPLWPGLLLTAYGPNTADAGMPDTVCHRHGGVLDSCGSPVDVFDRDGSVGPVVCVKRVAGELWIEPGATV